MAHDETRQNAGSTGDSRDDEVRRLRASEERWRSLVENAPAVITIIDRDGTVLSINQTISRRPRAEIVGANAYSFLPEEGRAQAQELIESEQRFRDIVRSLGDWVWETDSAGRLTYSSPQVEGVLGYTAAEMIGKTPADTIDPEDRARMIAGMEADIRTPRPFRDREIWHRHRDGHRVCLSVSGVPVFDAGGELRGFRGVAHDVTRQLREEAEVQQARRVESLGVLAGGIAHDFNNLLTAILGNAELALAELREEEGVRPLIAQIQSAGQHAALLTHQMLAYAGRGQIEARPVSIASAVRDMAQLLAASIPKKVELALALDDAAPAVEADPAQLRQVAMNLVLNAAEAIGEDEGRITVRTLAIEDADADRADFTLGKIENGRKLVCLEVTDSGCGIAHEALAKIFDPFFTTKFTGRGLGLAAVQGIVLRHNGTLAVRSAPGEGSTFRVCFPAGAPLAAPLPPPVPAAPVRAAAAAGPGPGNGTILIVDDEAPVRSMAARMVTFLGFRALTAVDGREALTVAAGAADLRLVLLDLTMPHLDGREAFRELRRLSPLLPVVLCSGYDVLESAERFTGLDFSGFLQKPYRLDDLARVLRRALDP